LDADGESIDNPTAQVQPIFNQGTETQFFKWNKSLIYIMQGQSVTEHYRLALQFLRGTDKALWQFELDIAGPLLVADYGISLDASAYLWYASITKLTVHVLKDACAAFKQKRYMECHLFKGNQTGLRNFMDRIDILYT
jgi:hypothetical protein